MLPPDELKRVKRDLPHFPEDVIQIWLSTFVRRFGWPPDIHPGWKAVLKGSKDLAFLEGLQDWRLVEWEIDPHQFTARDRSIITGLYCTHVLGQTTIYSEMSDGDDRFNSIVEYMREFGEFPRPIILANRNDTFEILDGYHRVTAMMYLYGYFAGTNEEELSLSVSIKQPAWVSRSDSVVWTQ